MNVKAAISNGSTALLVICAVLVTGVVIRKELFSPPPPEPQPTIIIANWKHLADTGHLFGPTDAKVTIIEFSDFQCPFCAQAEHVLRQLRERYPVQLRVVYRHFPLEELHPLARAAADASECAGEQGNFASYHDLLFAYQDSIGRVPWSTFARRAGVPNVAKFDECVALHRYDDVVANDIAAGADLRLSATPMFVVNGRLVAGALSAERWDQLIRDILGEIQTASK
ncbi:MAG TPA: thioredoxin domain-containing protein [Gemmatimonadaceae bacterium]|nr:thioredoxin domain-containing protein [Gemmatimonadaceae bacterium]